MTALDVKHAKQALSWRLAQWGITSDVEGKAASFIDDLVSKGWQMAPERESRRQPPRAGVNECRLHPGEHAVGCRACRADQIAGEPGPTVINRTPSTPPTAAYLAARGIRETETEEQTDADA